MVINRLCDPDSKLGVLRWLNTGSLPGIVPEVIEHRHLLRAMDALVEHREDVDQAMSALLRPLLDQDLAVVFYDMTTIRAEGLSEQEGDVRRFGMAKEGVVDRALPHPARDRRGRSRPAVDRQSGHVALHLERKAAEWSGKLDAQDAGRKSRGRKLSDGGARARFYHEVCDAHLSRIVRVDLKSERFAYDVDERALGRVRLMDGKLLLATNAIGVTAPEVIERYKSLADIECGFRVLRPEIEIEPGWPVSSAQPPYVASATRTGRNIPPRRSWPPQSPPRQRRHLHGRHHYRRACRGCALSPASGKQGHVEKPSARMLAVLLVQLRFSSKFAAALDGFSRCPQVPWWTTSSPIYLIEKICGS